MKPPAQLAYDRLTMALALGVLLEVLARSAALANDRPMLQAIIRYTGEKRAVN